ncbi:MAG: Probable reactivating factor for an aminomutase or amino-lyase [uncultured Nocardioidaceae bacterium]|uniref:Probable reactivating factor for an aminomutase or amino-lyase n=1 Tax=uncultured Nocardioidaceae bacterium TaxID=253824 RepID=A0A6J4M5R8_9ACTN|nr:MAG: Probable reactivating factor for an aminomutase or amino-lyase [uncultured Nocardioidaceae bacterium]
MSLVACVDFGSTFTKASLVDIEGGDLVATASSRTTVETDVLDGWYSCLHQLSEVEPGARRARLLACSSAGGGLRVAVVGNEELVTAEAGRRVALSSGGRVVHVASGGLDQPAISRLRESGPDVVLLVGGTDGGNSEVILGCARALADASWPTPVVVAGNAQAQQEIAGMLAGSGTPYVRSDNVVPQIGVLAPTSARTAVREMFLRHVIGGKHLSRGAEFEEMVKGATPDVVLTAVELLARGLDEERPGVGDVVVVDVGGATTDVHSVVEIDPEDAGLARQVVARVPVSRTVEGDLGMRWSAGSTVAEGLAAGLVPTGRGAVLESAAELRRKAPGYLPDSAESSGEEEEIASVAVTLALRRHAGRAQVRYGPDGRVVERTGTDLREVDLLVGSGGVLRESRGEVSDRILSAAVGEREGGWQLPRHPRVVVDRDYVLAPAGLLAQEYPEAAHQLVSTLVR